MQQQTKPTYRPATSTGFFCPYCGRAIIPRMRLSYPADAVGQFAPVYKCGCEKIVGEPLHMIQIAKAGV